MDIPLSIIKTSLWKLVYLMGFIGITLFILGFSFSVGRQMFDADSMVVTSGLTITAILGYLTYFFFHGVNGKVQEAIPLSKKEKEVEIGLVSSTVLGTLFAMLFYKIIGNGGINWLDLSDVLMLIAMLFDGLLFGGSIKYTIDRSKMLKSPEA